MSQLLHILTDLRNNRQIQILAEKLEESETGISKALGSMVATMLAGLMKSKNDQGAFKPGTTFEPALQETELAYLGNESNTGFLWDQLFGEEAPALLHTIGAFSGLKIASLQALKPLTGVMYLKALQQGGPNMLQREKAQILAQLPGGTAAFLGLVKVQTREEDGFRWFYAMLLLLIMGAILAYCLKQG